MRILVDRPAAPIAKHGISLDDPITDFWDMFSKNMNSPKKRAAKEVAQTLDNTHGALTPGYIFQLYHHEMETVVGPDNIGWIRSIEYLFSQQFRRVEDDRVPASANLAPPFTLADKPIPLAECVSRHNVKRRSGDSDEQPAKRVMAAESWLKANNMLEATFSFRKADVDALVIETQKPVRTRLKYNDSKAIAEHGWKVACRAADVGCDKDIFDFWDEQLTGFGYPLPCHGS